MILSNDFFDRDAKTVAKALLGKIIRVKQGRLLLSVQIIETEAYCKREKASHAFLAYTEKRKALFMPAGTIYMYYSRAGDSLNISCRGAGNAVLVKSGIPFQESGSAEEMIQKMQKLNPHPNRAQPRDPLYLCSGQTLLCKSLGLRVVEWDQKNFDSRLFFIEDCRQRPKKIIQTPRLGIPKGRDEHLLYRFVDYNFASYCTENPLRKRKWKRGENYFIITPKKEEISVSN